MSASSLIKSLFCCHRPPDPEFECRRRKMAQMALVPPKAPALHTSSSFDSSLSCDLKASSLEHFDGNLQVDDDLPSPALIKECGEMPVYSADGKARPFKSLYSNTEQKAERHMVIFIRHFFCGMCQDYLQDLATTFSPASLAASNPPASISIVGCGQPSMIANYRRNTGCPFPIYADPSRKIYHKLKMTASLDMGPRPQYPTTPLPEMMLRSIVQGLSHGTAALKGGNMRQVGGEFLFDNRGRLVWCHRMKNTRDHTNTRKLAGMLGVAL